MVYPGWYLGGCTYLPIPLPGYTSRCTSLPAVTVYRQHDQYSMHETSVNDTFDRLSVPSSGLKVRSEKDRERDLGHPEERLTLVKDCPETSRRKEVKRVVIAVPNKLPPFNCSESRDEPQCCFKAVSPWSEEEKSSERHLLTGFPAERKSLFYPCFSR